jgi:hypothetical protein
MTNTLHEAKTLQHGPMPWSELRTVLCLCHDARGESDTLKSVCEYVRTRLAATRVSMCGTEGKLAGHEATSVTVGRGPEISAALVQAVPGKVDSRAIKVLFSHNEVAVPIALGGVTFGALACGWQSHRRPDPEEATAVMVAAATAVAPTFVAFLDRLPTPTAGAAGSLGILGTSSAVTALRAALEYAGRTPFL